MRKLPIAGATVVLTLTLAGGALAASQFTQTSNVTLTGHHAGRSTGIRADIRSSDPSAPGGKPKAARRLVLTFPTGTRFNLRTVRFCTVSDARLTSPKFTTCPSSSRIGSGAATANGAPLPGFSTIRLRVRAFVRNASTILLQLTSRGAPPALIKASVSGRRLTIPIPTQKVSGIPIVLTGLQLSVPARSSGSRVLVRAGRCTRDRFVVRSGFRYVDGSRLTITSSSRCS